MTTLARKMDLLSHPNIAFSLVAFVSPSGLPVAQVNIIVSGLFTASRFFTSAASTNLPYMATLFMYKTIILALSNSLHPLHSLPFYTQILHTSLYPDQHTLPSIIGACSASQNATTFGLSLHSHVLRLALDTVIFVLNFFSMYSGWRDMDNAR